MKKYSVTVHDIKKRDGYTSTRYLIAWRKDLNNSSGLVCDNPNQVNLIPQLLREAGYEESERSVF